MDARVQNLTAWLQTILDTNDFSLLPLAGDASFRRYFRVKSADTCYIAMDAPPEHEESYPFVAIAKTFKNMDLCVPEVLAEDIPQGFLLLSDFGDRLFVKELNNDNADKLYKKALQALLVIQSCQEVSGWSLPQFDHRFIKRELEAFHYWFIARYLELRLTQKETQTLHQAFDYLIASACEQPQVCVHRDYHSRNLLLLDDNQVGIIDFQDAVWGPVSYDVVSLLRDCYIDWPKERVHDWALYYLEQAKRANILSNTSPKTFLQWFDLMGIQRHLKAIYIFSRKLLRDNDPGYLDDIPRTLAYTQTVCAAYPELTKFYQLLQQVIIPKFNEVFRR